MPEPDEAGAPELIRRAWESADLADYATSAEIAALAIERQPDDAFAHTLRAWALENLGRPHLDEARAEYGVALELDATAIWPRAALADLLHRSGSTTEAEQLYREVAEASGAALDQPRSLEFRGWSLYRLDRLDDAIQAFHASLERAPGRISVLFDLALSLLRNGKADEAIAAYDVALRAIRASELRRRRAPLTMAVEDLDDAIEAHPELVDIPGARGIAERLHGELAALGPPPTPPSDGPNAAI